MAEKWIICNEILPRGLEIVIDDQAFWTDPIEEFGIDCEIISPLKASFTLLRQEEGLLIRGHMQGEVELTCDLCSEPSRFKINQRFDNFEEYPNLGDDDDVDEISCDTELMRTNNGNLELNLAGLLWEEFSLILPVHPVCTENCKGLCQECGKNLNNEKCTCQKDDGDPRLAVLRNLKLNK